MNLSVYFEEYGKKTFPFISHSSEQSIPSPGNQLYLSEQNNWITGCVRMEQIRDCVLISLHLECIPDPYNYLRSFQEQKAAALEICPADFVPKDVSSAGTYQRGLAIRKYSPFWTTPVFFSAESGETFDCLQQLLIDNVHDRCSFFLPLAGSYGVTDIELSPNSRTLQLCFHPYRGATTVIDAPLAIISNASNPYQAVEAGYQLAWEKQLILTPSRSLKQYPAQLKGLGWCTWNAFYHDATADGIKAKLEEFKEKKVPVKWIIIDDGWSQTKDFKLLSPLEDRSKFPKGLKAFIQEIKADYSVEYVGVWHAFTGYWFGISPEGDLMPGIQCSETPSGLLLPGTSEEDAYDFFYHWHHYLKEQGVDFLKVDAQGNTLEFLRHSTDCCKKVQNIHNALEKSVAENFDSSLINCMGLGSLDMFSRKYSSLVRNSDDFFPDKKNGFTSHILQNAYNGIFNSQLYYCDFDMWWTKHFSAKQSSVLRAISGGPVYISDKVGETDPGYLLPLIDEEGNILRCEDTAKPTADCLFTNPTNNVLKLYNRIGNNYVLAAFNLSDTPKEVSVQLSDFLFDDINAHSYQAVFYYSKKDMILDQNTVTFPLGPNDVEIINLYLLDDKGMIARNRDKYIGIFS